MRGPAGSETGSEARKLGERAGNTDFCCSTCQNMYGIIPSNPRSQWQRGARETEIPRRYRASTPVLKMLKFLAELWAHKAFPKPRSRDNDSAFLSLE